MRNIMSKVHSLDNTLAINNESEQRKTLIAFRNISDPGAGL